MLIGRNKGDDPPQEKAATENANVFNLLGVGTESSIELDRKYQAMPSEETASWDAFAMRQMGLQAAPLDPAGRVPHLPVSAFHTKGKKKSIELPVATKVNISSPPHPPPPSNNLAQPRGVERQQPLPSLNTLYAQDMRHDRVPIQMQGSTSQKRQPTLNRLYAQERANSSLSPAEDQAQLRNPGPPKRQPTLNRLYAQKASPLCPPSLTSNGQRQGTGLQGPMHAQKAYHLPINRAPIHPADFRPQKRQPTLDQLFAQKASKISRPN